VVICNEQLVVNMTAAYSTILKCSRNVVKCESALVCYITQ